MEDKVFGKWVLDAHVVSYSLACAGSVSPCGPSQGLFQCNNCGQYRVNKVIFLNVPFRFRPHSYVLNNSLNPGCGRQET